MTPEEELVRVLAAMRTRWLTDRMILIALAMQINADCPGEDHRLYLARVYISEALRNVYDEIVYTNQIIDLDTLQQRGT